MSGGDTECTWPCFCTDQRQYSLAPSDSRFLYSFSPFLPPSSPFDYVNGLTYYFFGIRRDSAKDPVSLKIIFHICESTLASCSMRHNDLDLPLVFLIVCSTFLFLLFPCFVIFGLIPIPPSLCPSPPFFHDGEIKVRFKTKTVAVCLYIRCSYTRASVTFLLLRSRDVVRSV